MAKQTNLRLGVLLSDSEVQLLDLGPVDLFFMLSKEYLAACNLPQVIVDRGIDNIEIFYIGEKAKGVVLDTATTSPSSEPSKLTKFAKLTANIKIPITHDLNDQQVAPGTLDIILVPGPDPSAEVSEPTKSFIRKHAEIEHVHILSICTGIFVLGEAGLLDGKPCTGPRALVGMQLKKKYPKGIWSERRWEIDPSGRLWTAGGITNGQEMVAAYLRRHFNKDTADLVCSMADVGYRGQDYESSNTSEGFKFLWILVRGFANKILGGEVKGGRRAEIRAA